MVTLPLLVVLGIAIVLVMYMSMTNGRASSRWIPRDSQGRILAFGMIVLTVAFVLFVSNYTGVWTMSKWDKLHANSGLESGLNKRLSLAVTPSGAELGKDFYGIMFDAGSTGTRIHVFKFKHIAPGLPFELEDELFLEVKPGLSAYADDPEKAAQSVSGLLDKAKDYIPVQHWENTPLALKATAGLRLLSKEKADAILMAVTTMQNRYPFKTSSDSVQIMEGSEEGIFSFITLNFLKKTISNAKQMHGVMDLGGGSTQITLVPFEESTIKSVSEDYMEDIDVFGIKYHLYTRSYLGLGLMSGRLQTMGQSQTEQSEKGSYKSLKSACFPGQIRTHWMQGGTNYTIYGMDVEGSRFEACYKAATNVVKDVQKLKEVKTKTFNIISYYYDRAVDAGLIDKKDGGELQVKNYFEAAKVACSEAKPIQEAVFLCLDLSYISALIHEGFGFDMNTKVHLQKKINGREVSWALGAMFHYFTPEDNGVR